MLKRLQIVSSSSNDSSLMDKIWCFSKTLKLKVYKLDRENLRSCLKIASSMILTFLSLTFITAADMFI